MNYNTNEVEFGCNSVSIDRTHSYIVTEHSSQEKTTCYSEAKTSPKMSLLEPFTGSVIVLGGTVTYKTINTEASSVWVFATAFLLLLVIRLLIARAEAEERYRQLAARVEAEERFRQLQLRKQECCIIM